jgi:hypothetical protein
MAASQPATVEITARGFSVTTADWTCQVNHRTRASYTERGYWSATRVYGALDTFATELMTKVEKNCATPITAEVQQNDPEFAAKHMAEYRSLKGHSVRKAKTEMLAALADVLNEDQIVELSAKFSGRAGCSCPCSPGFVLDRRLAHDGHPVDIWFSAPARSNA